MKMDMRVTQHDKKLLILLISLVLAFVCYNYVISPQIDKWTLLKTTESAQTTELNRVKTLIEKKDSLQTNVENKKNSLSEKYSIFFYELNQEKILNKFNDLFTLSGLTVTSYAPEKITVAAITIPSSQYTYNKYPLLNYASQVNPDVSSVDKGQAVKNQAKTSSNDTANDKSIPSFNLTISFNSSPYSAVMNFIKSLESMDKAIIITKVDIKKDDVNLSGQILLTLYAMPKVSDDENGYLSFTPSAITGKTDPFQ